ncbi:hypothetical protein CTI12_AA572710 [Artemisia annua]|uniref:Uncharacterized protein n=1 Tax=Artemisia annua TaxID=35608 RepID=A0A2U1KRM4_ARTAN|nr:hypothetical protein CTI12_AA572710 [Artemisia annua]
MGGGSSCLRLGGGVDGWLELYGFEIVVLMGMGDGCYPKFMVGWWNDGMVVGRR